MEAIVSRFPAWNGAHWKFIAICGAILIAVLLAAAVWLWGKHSLKSRAAFSLLPARSLPSWPFMGGAALRVGNAHHIGKRESQQDAFGISNLSDARMCKRKGVLAVVADGMGGLTDSGRISARIVSHFLSRFSTETDSGNPSDELLHMTMEANSLVCSWLRANHCRSGSTLIATIIRGGFLFFTSVGDSRIYLLRGGELIQLNREHTYAARLAEQVARGDITQEQAKNDPQRLALTSYIGIDGELSVDYNMQPIRLRAGDRILLMTDGVFGTLSGEEICTACLAEAPAAAAKLEELIIAKRKSKQDNFTAIVLEYL